MWLVCLSFSVLIGWSIFYEALALQKLRPLVLVGSCTRLNGFADVCDLEALLMPSFGARSIQKLETCDQRIQRVLYRVVEVYDITVLEGRRSWEQQLEYFETGRSKVKPGCQGAMHVPLDPRDVAFKSLAVDIAPYPIDWADTKRFTYMAGVVMGVAASMGVDLRWGGNWDRDQVIIDDQNFNDLPHFELVD